MVIGDTMHSIASISHMYSWDMPLGQRGFRGVGRWFGKGGSSYRSIGKGSMISVYKIESSYITIRKHRGAPAPGAPMVPTPMGLYSGKKNTLSNGYRTLNRSLMKVDARMLGPIDIHPQSIHTCLLLNSNKTGRSVRPSFVQ